MEHVSPPLRLGSLVDSRHWLAERDTGLEGHLLAKTTGIGRVRCWFSLFGFPSTLALRAFLFGCDFGFSMAVRFSKMTLPARLWEILLLMHEGAIFLAVLYLDPSGI